jgi:hypothetical protein
MLVLLATHGGMLSEIGTIPRTSRGLLRKHKIGWFELVPGLALLVCSVLKMEALSRLDFLFGVLFGQWHPGEFDFAVGSLG